MAKNRGRNRNNGSGNLPTMGEDATGVIFEGNILTNNDEEIGYGEEYLVGQANEHGANIEAKDEATIQAYEKWSNAIEEDMYYVGAEMGFSGEAIAFAQSSTEDMLQGLDNDEMLNLTEDDIRAEFIKAARDSGL